MRDYYSSKLSAERLRAVYEIAPPRIQQYLQAEIDYVLAGLSPDDIVLELGCGYGRVLRPLAESAGLVIGVDTSLDSLRLAQHDLCNLNNCFLASMNAAKLGVADRSVSVVVCIQNGVSAFHVDPRLLIREAVRATAAGGRLFFSTYSEKFWVDRLHWFELQSQHGLVGEIDYERTGNGVIVCNDGFTATTMSPQDFQAITRGLPVDCKFAEVDSSTLFCTMVRR